MQILQILERAAIKRRANKRVIARPFTRLILFAFGTCATRDIHSICFRRALALPVPENMDSFELFMFSSWPGIGNMDSFEVFMFSLWLGLENMDSFELFMFSSRITKLQPHLQTKKPSQGRTFFNNRILSRWLQIFLGTMGLLSGFRGYVWLLQRLIVTQKPLRSYRWLFQQGYWSNQ